MKFETRRSETEGQAQREQTVETVESTGAECHTSLKRGVNEREGNSDSRGLRFDRHELAGAFGDLGTDLPLIAAMILAARLDAGNVLLVFGAFQILTGVLYRMPMPVQPLKAMAAIVITQKLSGATLYGGGLAIGVLMLVL